MWQLTLKRKLQLRLCTEFIALQEQHVIIASMNAFTAISIKGHDVTWSFSACIVKEHVATLKSAAARY